MQDGKTAEELLQMLATQKDAVLTIRSNTNNCSRYRFIYEI